MHAANETMDRTAAEIIFWATKYDAVPSRAEVEQDSRDYSSSLVQFCNAQRLPIRDLSTAANPNG
jgi:hypothetical protein